MLTVTSDPLTDLWRRIYSTIADSWILEALQGPSITGLLLLITLSLVISVLLVGVNRITARRWPKAWWPSVLVMLVILPLSIFLVYEASHIEGLAFLALSLFILLIVWMRAELIDHQQKFLEHEKQLIEIFEHNSGLNEEARKLHLVTLTELRNAQASLVGRFDRADGFYIGAYQRKLQEVLRQIGKHEVYGQRDEFADVWQKLVDISSNYLSVCDLSFYADVTVRADDAETKSIYDEETNEWTGRVQRELEELIKTRKSPHSFQKVIVYSPLQRYDGPEKPPCADGNRCEYLRCGKACIVKTVTKLWKDNERHFEDNVSLFSRIKGTRKTPFIWQVRKTDIDAKFRAITGAGSSSETSWGTRGKPLLDSVDIGVFGAYFVGEEFKVPAGIGKPSVKDYLFRIRFDSNLANRIYLACKELQDSGALHTA
jgi:uncharacterized membrane protein